MIRVVGDNGFDVTVETAAALSTSLEKMFPSDPNSEVLLTYVITSQPQSRRMAVDVSDGNGNGENGNG